MRFFILEDVLEGCPGPPLHLLAVFLLELLVERVLVLEDKMKLGIASTLVRPKHNRVGGLDTVTTIYIIRQKYSIH